MRPDLGDASEPLEAKAKAAYKARLEELEAELEETERLQAGHAHRLVPSAAFLNTGATRPGVGPACFGAVVCLCVLIDLPAGMVPWVAKPVTRPVRNREARVTGPRLA